MQYHMTAKNLTAGYNGNPVFRNFEIKIPSGKITTLIGANGSGKSTVLKTLARLLTPLEGVVYLDGESIHRMPTKSVAQKLAMLPQGAQTPAGITVQDLAEYGRYWIAMALAQKTGILFLDEPTTYLDISHQLEILQLLRELNVQQGVTVVMVLHDLNHAIMFSDYLVTIKDGKKYLEGSPEEVVTPHMLQEVFDVEAEVIQHPVLHVPVCLPYGVRGQTFAKDMKEV